MPSDCVEVLRNGDLWVVKMVGGAEPLGEFASKDDALAEAKQHAHRREDCEVVVRDNADRG